MIAWVVIYRRHRRQSRKSRADCPSIFRIFFQVPYAATPLFATLTKTAGVCTNNSQFGTLCSPRHASLAIALKSFPIRLFRTLLHFFALIQNSTLLFSNASALFAKKHRGGGRELMLIDNLHRSTRHGGRCLTRWSGEARLSGRWEAQDGNSEGFSEP
jgi:hypothetical protein